MLPFTPLFIDGKQVPASDGKTFEIKNPFSNQVVGTCASATSEDCQNAILAAGKAFKTWEHSTLGERRAIFLRAAELLKLEKYKSSIAVSVTEETAAAPALASINWGSSLALLTEAVTLTNELDGISFPSKVKGGMVAVERRAMGVILATAPWNAPVNLTLRSCLIPILCGNTVVFRSSEISPRSQFIVVELFQEAGLPAGVFNFISTSREDAPHLTAQIIAHPLVRKINFTGSDRVGRAIAMEAAKHLKPCVLELGGKAPVVVLEDADINEAAKAIVSSALLHSGQICMSTERVIAQRAVFDRLQEAVCALFRKVRSGDARVDANNVKLGALFSEGSAENVLAMIQEAQSAGAQVLVGDLGRNGSLVQPHVVTNVRPGMRLWDRETFGPVVVIVPADSLDEAVELANASDYSLSAGLWTSNIYLAKEISSRIHSGYVNINGPTVHSEVSYGLVGLGGSSGYGRFSIPDFTDQRVTVTHPLGASYPILD